MNVTGKVVNVTPVHQVSDKFKKCEVWIETTSGTYTETIPVQFTQSLADEAQGLTVGSEVCVTIRVGGRTWTGNDGVTKCFGSITAVNILSAEKPQPQAEQVDDLPF